MGYLPDGPPLREYVIRRNPSLEYGTGVVFPWHHALALPQHFETGKNRSGQHGSGDERLTERGREQAAAAGRRLGIVALRAASSADRGNFVMRVYASPDDRCVNSANEFNLHLNRTIADSTVRRMPTCIVPELGRLGLGELDGLTDQQIARADPPFARLAHQWRQGILDRPPDPSESHGGEPLSRFWGRVYDAVGQISGEISAGPNALAVLFVPDSTRTAIHARCALVRDADDIAPDGIPYRVPALKDDRETVRLYGIGGNGYIEPTMENISIVDHTPGRTAQSGIQH